MKTIDFNSTERQTILTLHNKFRNYIASGSNILFRPAKRMAFMEWDSTLAYVASFNAKSCDFRHDECRNTSNVWQTSVVNWFLKFAQNFYKLTWIFHRKVQILWSKFGDKRNVASGKNSCRNDESFYGTHKLVDRGRRQVLQPKFHWFFSSASESFVRILTEN